MRIILCLHKPRNRTPYITTISLFHKIGTDLFEVEHWISTKFLNVLLLDASIRSRKQPPEHDSFYGFENAFYPTIQYRKRIVKIGFLKVSGSFVLHIETN